MDALANSSSVSSCPSISVYEAPTVVASVPAEQFSPCLELKQTYQPRFFLDIFSGASMAVSMACKKLSIDVFEPVDLIHGQDILDDDKFFHILKLAESGLIGAAVAAPYCCKHSRATLRRPGPRPVRTPEFMDGLPTNTISTTGCAGVIHCARSSSTSLVCGGS